MGKDKTTREGKKANTNKWTRKKDYTTDDRYKHRGRKRRRHRHLGKKKERYS